MTCCGMFISEEVKEHAVHCMLQKKKYFSLCSVQLVINCNNFFYFNCCLEFCYVALDLEMFAVARNCQNNCILGNLW